MRVAYNHWYIGFRLIAGNRPTILKLTRHGGEVGVFIVEHRVQSNYVAERIGHKDIQFEAFVSEYVTETSCDSRVGRTFIFQIIKFLPFLKVDTGSGQFSVNQILWNTVRVEPCKRDGKQSAHGIAFTGETVAGYQFHHAGESFQLGHFIFGVGEDKVRIPRKIFRANVAGGKGELHTVGFHRGYVGIFVDETAHSLRGNYTDQVIVVALIPVGREIDPVFEQTEVDADVQFMLFLVGEFAVLDVLDVKSRFLNIGKRTIGRETADDGLRIGYFRRTAIGSKRVRSFQSQVGKSGLERFKKSFLMHVPRTGQVPRGQPA